MRLKNEVFHLLRKLFQQHTAQWQYALPGLTKPQYAVMRAIDEYPGIEQVALTEAAASTKATLTEMLKRMESKKLIRRQPDPQDKRRRFLFLTPEGKKLLQECKPTSNRIDDEFLNRLSEKERQQFIELIYKMLG